MMWSYHNNYEDTKKAVALIGEQCMTESSGGINEKTANRPPHPKKGGNQPPKKKITERIDIRIILAYSPRKKIC